MEVKGLGEGRRSYAIKGLRRNGGRRSYAIKGLKRRSTEKQCLSSLYN